jgi:hypothetical protein
MGQTHIKSNRLNLAGGAPGKPQEARAGHNSIPYWAIAVTVRRFVRDPSRQNQGGSAIVFARTICSLVISMLPKMSWAYSHCSLVHTSWRAYCYSKKNALPTPKNTWHFCRHFRDG